MTSKVRNRKFVLFELTNHNAIVFRITHSSIVIGQFKLCKPTISNLDEEDEEGSSKTNAEEAFDCINAIKRLYNLCIGAIQKPLRIHDEWQETRKTGHPVFSWKSSTSFFFEKFFDVTDF